MEEMDLGVKEHNGMAVVRSHLSAEQLYLMKEMQNYAVAMIHSGIEFAQRKQKLIELKDYLLSQMGGMKHVN